MSNHYQTLGVDKNASPDDIKKAFRKLAHEYHPDKKGGDEERFKQVNEAYNILGNKGKKEKYDVGGSNQFSLKVLISRVLINKGLINKEILI